VKLDAVYDPGKDMIQISYQETPSSPVTTIDIARGHEHHVRHALDDLLMEEAMVDQWEYHFRDQGKDYDP